MTGTSRIGDKHDGSEYSAALVDARLISGLRAICIDHRCSLTGRPTCIECGAATLLSAGPRRQHASPADTQVTDDAVDHTIFSRGVMTFDQDEDLVAQRMKCFRALPVRTFELQTVENGSVVALHGLVVGSRWCIRRRALEVFLAMRITDGPGNAARNLPPDGSGPRQISIKETLR